MHSGHPGCTYDFLLQDYVFNVNYFKVCSILFMSLYHLVNLLVAFEVRDGTNLHLSSQLKSDDMFDGLICVWIWDLYACKECNV